MHRFILAALLLACLVCMFEAFPNPQETQTEELSDLEKVQKALQETLSNVEKQAKELVENLKLQDAVQNLGQAVQDAANKVREGTEKLIS